MKKTIILLVVMISVVAFGFSQTAGSTEVETISEQGTTDESLPFLLTIEYLPLTGEAVFTFTMNSDLFEKSTAMITIRNRAEQFLKERTVGNVAEGARADQLYYSYNYQGADLTRYDLVNNMTHYSSRIRFTETRDLNYADN